MLRKIKINTHLSPYMFSIQNEISHAMLESQVDLGCLKIQNKHELVFVTISFTYNQSQLYYVI